MHNSWQPTATIQNLQRRAEILSQIRAFFAKRNVMEVDTHLLSHCAVSDPFIDSMQVNYQSLAGGDITPMFLQTSPEYAMKRLLCAGSGPIYQLAKVFRNGESGRRHNPEFTLLEWYQTGFNLPQLMQEVEALIQSILPYQPFEYISYRDVFQRTLQLDPFTASLAELKSACREQVEASFEDEDRDTWLNLLMSHFIEPQLNATFVHSYPPSQAALAKITQDDYGTPIAARFEVYVQGIELANGYHELTDAQEQQKRLKADHDQRKQLGLPTYPLEMRLVQALEHGLPDCSGVALGVDRLIMLALNCNQIREVIPFSIDRA
ncbi:EF-P lysine aminoacylase EpmA [Nitrincola tibetensis]|uniref:EF-P lysine aminoacylase EpmA n=1 Tax=Nitrincola tibetensis TaxID=2219697 RepID=UPI003B83A00B